MQGKTYCTPKSMLASLICELQKYSLQKDGCIIILYSDGKVMLPLPSIEVLSEAAQRSDRKGTVIHIMETSVISWMKQVKVGQGCVPHYL